MLYLIILLLFAATMLLYSDVPLAYLGVAAVFILLGLTLVLSWSKL